MSFNTLGLGPSILRALGEIGYKEPTPIQTAAIPHVLSGADLIGIAQTGTGKTAAFVLPILERLMAERPAATSRRLPRVLVLAPTRELAAQIEENVRLFSKHLPIRSATIFGGVGEQPQIQAVRRGVDIVVATPGRLIDLMGGGHVPLDQVRILVLDEADRMLDMGFLPAIKRIVARVPKQRQTLLFSATLSKEIEKIAGELLDDPRKVEIGRATPTASVKQILYSVDKGAKVDLLRHVLKDPALDSVLVFSRTKHGADKIAKRLETAGIRTATMHSNRSQAQRIRALSAFKTGSVRVLVATDIAARGIDVQEISHVINFDFPMHAEDYVHRIGRTGRAAATGDAISFVTHEDEEALRDVQRLIGRTIERQVVAGFEPGPAPRVSAPASRPSGSYGRSGSGQRQHSAPPRPGQPGPRGRAFARPAGGESRRSASTQRRGR